MALEAINRNASILRDYKLKLLANNGQCAADIVMKTFIEYVLNGRYKTLAGILGEEAVHENGGVPPLTFTHTIMKQSVKFKSWTFRCKL